MKKKQNIKKEKQWIFIDFHSGNPRMIAKKRNVEIREREEWKEKEKKEEMKENL